MVRDVDQAPAEEGSVMAVMGALRSKAAWTAWTPVRSPAPPGLPPADERTFVRPTQPRTRVRCQGPYEQMFVPERGLRYDPNWRSLAGPGQCSRQCSLRAMQSQGNAVSGPLLAGHEGGR